MKNTQSSVPRGTGLGNTDLHDCFSWTAYCNIYCHFYSAIGVILRRKIKTLSKQVMYLVVE